MPSPAWSKDVRVAHLVNQVISLKEDDIKRSNEVLKEVLTEVTQFLKNKDAFFRDCYEKFAFVGSFYKGTKIDLPNEFDVNVIIRLPILDQSIEFHDYGFPGYTAVTFTTNNFKPKFIGHMKLVSSWLDEDKNICQNKFRQWMEGLFSNIPNTISIGCYNYKLRVKKSGPAFTLLVSEGDLEYELSIDLVPVLQFKDRNFLIDDYTDLVQNWYAVPKPLNLYNTKLSNILWRISLYDAERKILKSYDNAYLKPTIRQVKKLRNKYNWNFASYYIETICLFMISQYGKKLRSFGEIRLFCTMLAFLSSVCEDRSLPNYWFKDHNLIEDLSPAQLDNMGGLIKKIIRSIEEDQLKFANWILTESELMIIQTPLNRIRNGEWNLNSHISHPENIQQVNQSWCIILMAFFLFLTGFNFYN